MLVTSFKGMNKKSRAEILSIPRGESSRRELTIMNPYRYFMLVKKLVDNEAKINSYFPSSPYSLSFPTNSASLVSRALMPSSSSVLFYQQEMLKRSIGKNVVLKLDVNNFYQSIYTHAIEWAFVGKDDAKRVWAKDIKTGVVVDGYELGKSLDENVMHSQDDETHGIPVGPDTSFFIGELLLCRVDYEIQSRYPDLKGCRYYDDYTFFLDNVSQAKELLKYVQTVMRRYGLDVNERKVEIKSVPCSMVDNTMKEVLPYKGLVSVSPSTLLGYFDTVWYLAEQNPKKKHTIFKYALKTLLAKSFSSVWDVSNQELLHTLLLKTISIDPMIIPIVYLLFQEKNTHFVDLVSVATCLKEVLLERTHYQHHAEIAWALWMVNRYSVPITKSVLFNILNLNNSICTLQVLAYLEKPSYASLKHDDGIKDKMSEIESSFSDETLYGPQWLLLYEGTIKGWFKGKKWIDKNSYFKFLFDRKVSFYETDKDADFNSESYLKKYLFANIHAPKIEKEAFEKSKEVWKRLKSDFYKDNTLSLDEDDFNEKIKKSISEEDVLSEIFSRIMMREAHLSDESLDELEVMLQKRLASCFSYFTK